MKKDIFIKPNDIIIFDDSHKLFCGNCTKICRCKIKGVDNCGKQIGLSTHKIT